MQYLNTNHLQLNSSFHLQTLYSDSLRFKLYFYPRVAHLLPMHMKLGLLVWYAIPPHLTGKPCLYILLCFLFHMVMLFSFPLSWVARGSQILGSSLQRALRLCFLFFLCFIHLEHSIPLLAGEDSKRMKSGLAHESKRVNRSKRDRKRVKSEGMACVAGCHGYWEAAD